MDLQPALDAVPAPLAAPVVGPAVADSWKTYWRENYECDEPSGVPYPRVPLSGLLEASARRFPNEPACTLYQLHKTEDPTTYVMLEQYQSQDDLAKHRETPHFKTLGGKLGEFLAAAPGIQILPAVE